MSLDALQQRLARQARHDRLPASLSDNYLIGDVDALQTPLAVVQAATPRDRIHESALALARHGRELAHRSVGMDAFLTEYSLGSEEGVLLMCLAEALLRIPDNQTASLLVQDKLAGADWDAHIGKNESFLVNASTWGLLLTGRFFAPQKTSIPARLRALFGTMGDRLALSAIRQAMRLIGRQFVISQSIDKALENAGPYRENERLTYSFDMLGEAAVCDVDAATFFGSYMAAIAAIGRHYRGARPGVAAISIKLSALEARFEPGQRSHVLETLPSRLEPLLAAAREANVQVTIDAEESSRLHLSLEVFRALLESQATADWNGLGLAVQSYQKRASACISWLLDLARSLRKTIPIRLVKGAYWDSEIKRAQQLGLPAYPVYRWKAATDLSFLACALQILKAGDALYGQFASHNAYSLAAVFEYGRAEGNPHFEIQSLYGMGESIGEAVTSKFPNTNRRIYAPVGTHQDLLPYLMRRLLENGANTSFVHHLADASLRVEDLVTDPASEVALYIENPSGGLPLPGDLLAPRRNSAGVNLDDERIDSHCRQRILTLAKERSPDRASALPHGARDVKILSPAMREHHLGTVPFAAEGMINAALDTAAGAFPGWRGLAIAERASCLRRLANIVEEEWLTLASLCVFEAGKTLACAHAEIREAIDFCRYYADQAAELKEVRLPGPVGEENLLMREGKGIMLCISPWNFPVAIFLGQIVASLAAGNVVVAKPSEYSSMVALAATHMAHRAGIPESVLQCLPGHGQVLEKSALQHPELAGVVFTGSTATAHRIQGLLAQRRGPIVPLIAETGGLNCMIVDSSALLEQVVWDVLISAFDSAGQRCSALRMLYVQKDIFAQLQSKLAGAVRRLRVGHPLYPDTDVGPLINAAAMKSVARYRAELDSTCRLVVEAPLPSSLDGFYMPPAIYVRDSLDLPDREVFGPVLCMAAWSGSELTSLLQRIRNSGYALTLGLHSRLKSRVSLVREHLPVGNFYVNRNMVGAVVGVQPFGGFGLSGTGPKAGGPYYLPALCRERTVSINTAAEGGDAELLASSSFSPGGRQS